MLEKLAVALFEKCQDKSKSVSNITDDLLVEQFGRFPNNREAIEDVVRKYKNSGAGLEDSANKIIALMDGKVIEEVSNVSVDVVSDVNKVSPGAEIKLTPQFAAPEKAFELFTMPPVEINSAGRLIRPQQDEYPFDNPIYFNDPGFPQYQNKPLTETVLSDICDARFKQGENRWSSKGPDVVRLAKILARTQAVNIADIEYEGTVSVECSYAHAPDQTRAVTKDVYSFNDVKYVAPDYAGSELRTVSQWVESQEQGENALRRIKEEKLEKFKTKVYRDSEEDIIAYFQTREDISDPAQAFEIVTYLKEECRIEAVNLAMLEENYSEYLYEDESNSTITLRVETEDDIYDRVLENRCCSIADNAYDYAKDQLCNESVEEWIEYDGSTNWKDIGNDTWIIEDY